MPSAITDWVKMYTISIFIRNVKAVLTPDITEGLKLLHISVLLNIMTLVHTSGISRLNLMKPHAIEIRLYINIFEL